MRLHLLGVHFDSTVDRSMGAGSVSVADKSERRDILELALLQSRLTKISSQRHNLIQIWRLERSVDASVEQEEVVGLVKDEEWESIPALMCWRK